MAWIEEFGGGGFATKVDTKISIGDGYFAEFKDPHDKAKGINPKQFGRAFTDEGYMTKNYMKPTEGRERHYIEANPYRFKFFANKDLLIEAFPEFFI